MRNSYKAILALSATMVMLAYIAGVLVSASTPPTDRSPITFIEPSGASGMPGDGRSEEPGSATPTPGPTPRASTTPSPRPEPTRSSAPGPSSQGPEVVTPSPDLDDDFDDSDDDSDDSDDSNDSDGDD